jgi:hypothetical protein
MNRKHKKCYYCLSGGHVKIFFYKPSVRVEWNLNLDSRIVPFAKGVIKK